MPVQKEGVWDVCVSSKTGDEYYFNPATKQSLWKKHEPPLPAGWGWGKEDGGRGGRFYVNLHTLARQSAAPESGAAPSGPSLKRPRSDEPEASSAPFAAAAPAAPAAAHPTDSGSAAAQAVGEAYNRIVEQGREERGTSPIFHVRNFPNFIKSCLFQMYAPQHCPRVLDLCCGRLADLLSKLRAKRVQRYCGVDIAGESLELGVKRLGEAKGLGGLGVKLVCADLGVTDLAAAGVFAPEEAFDLITVQFALHYFFQTEARALAFFSNIAGRLAPGGVFLGTTTDADVLVRRAREAGAAAAAAAAGVGGGVRAWARPAREPLGTPCTRCASVRQPRRQWCGSRGQRCAAPVACSTTFG